MNKKTFIISILGLLGVYFLLFHTPPFPFSHEAIGLPPYHMIHAGFGVVLLLGAFYYWRK